jgi:phosphoribosylformylglycinamidine (FGAM) synthase-like enzyme
MWQFAEVVRGLADGCAALGVSVTGGNVSFYNSTGAMAIYPTPIVGVLGVLDDVALFSESAARAVVAMRAGTELRVRELCEATGVPYTAIGTTGGDALPVGDLFDVRFDELRAVHEATLPVAFER